MIKILRIDINVGSKCENLLATLSTECALEIQSTCLNFYKTTFKELLKPLSYNDSLFEQL